MTRTPEKPTVAAPEISRAAGGVLRVSAETFGFARGESAPSEDSAVAKEFDGAFVAAVADGLGSAKEGGAAAARATESLTRNFPARPRAWSAGKTLEEIFRHLNRRLHQEGMARFESPELATTIAAIAIEGGRVFLLNAGDSRVYLWRGGSLRQLSIDHREDHPDRTHVLTRAMGLVEELTPATLDMPVCAGDVLLLCTDGVSDVLSDDALAALLGRGAGASTIASEARQLATDATRDDLTVVTVRVLEIGPDRRATDLAARVPDKLKVGDVVDGFTLRRSFRASDRIWLAAKAGESFVLKFATRDAAQNETALAAFLREVWHATQLQAEFFPAAFVPENATARYYALEYINAPTLKQFIAEHGPLQPAQVVELARFILRAEQFLIRHDFVHGDLKPENLLVLRSGAGFQPVAAGFQPSMTGTESSTPSSENHRGLEAQPDRLEACPTTRRSSASDIGFKLIDLGSVAEVFSHAGRAGTPSYLAPERFNGAAVTERTEIFSLGVMLYEALTGKFPYGEVEPFQTPVFGTVRSPTSLNPHVPPWLEAIVLRAIAANPDQRYEAYSEMLFELENPAKVRPFHRPDSTWIERNPLLFFKTGFFVLLVVCVVLLFKLLSR